MRDDLFPSRLARPVVAGWQIMFRRHALALALLLALVVRGYAAEAPVPPPHRVVIVSIDGLRPDLALRASMPVLRQIMHQGSYTFWARTTAMSVTLPSHVSMLTGVEPHTHGIIRNGDVPAADLTYPNVPTIFDLAHEAGLSTAMAAGKSKFVALARPGSLDWVFIPEKSAKTDREVMDQALAMLQDHQPRLLMIHLPVGDSMGHRHGWGSAEHIAAIEAADVELGRLWAALDAAGLRDQTLLIVSADHGGAGRTHGPDDPRSRHIPWIITGPGVRADYDLTLQPKRVVLTEDTFATAAMFLGLTLPEKIAGSPVLEAFTPASP